MSSLVHETVDPPQRIGNDLQPGPVSLSGWRVAAVVLALGLITASGLWQLHLFNREMASSKSDLVPVWVGTRATLQHRDAYSEQVTREIQTLYYGRPLRASDTVNKMSYAYPAYTAVVLSPLTRVSWPAARLSFLVIVPLTMAWTVWAWLRIARIEVSREWLAVLTVLTLTSWPMMWGLRLQQVSLIVAALIAAGCYLLTQQRDLSAGLLLALATIKPQLAVPLIAWLLLWAVLHRRWSFVASVLGGTFALFASAAWAAPGWISRWAAAMADYNHYIHPQPMLQNMFGAWAGSGLTLVLASFGVIVLWRIRGCSTESPEFGMALSVLMAMTVAFQPTTLPMIYNEVLLLPAILVILYARTMSGYPALIRIVALAALVFSFIAVPVAVLCEFIWGPLRGLLNLPFINPFLPVLVTLAAILYAWPQPSEAEAFDEAAVCAPS
jgi:hypothetical protein